ncbi:MULTISPECIES: hypothetical protein [unclassified Enterococcus]|uniref:hypothetical protein n=1 Tax=unclassified Enterococcus TaxID=2608891 RepID=UPI001A9B5422|nr:hypothetical protein [Enterococcus sp. DIV1271a]MBO1300962.1 hypothetical protein [Enterococcus sp. DIV1271a]
MKFRAAFLYRLKHQFLSLSAFLALFILLGIILPLIGIFLLSDFSRMVHSDGIIECMIYMFFLSYIGMNSDFKLFIQNGVSRVHILFTHILTNVILAVVFSLIMLLLIMLLNSNLIVQLKWDVFLFSLYSRGDFLIDWFFFSLLLILPGSIGLFLSSLNSRLSRSIKFIVLLVLLLLPIPISTFMQSSSSAFQTNTLDMLQKMIGYQYGEYSLSPVLLTLTATILFTLLLTYLLNRRREIKILNV